MRTHLSLASDEGILRREDSLAFSTQWPSDTEVQGLVSKEQWPLNLRHGPSARQIVSREEISVCRENPH